MVLAFAGDSTMTSVLPLADRAVLFLAAFLADFFAVVGLDAFFAVAILIQFLLYNTKFGTAHQEKSKI